jgi:hypothetical protein
MKTKIGIHENPNYYGYTEKHREAQRSHREAQRDLLFHIQSVSIDLKLNPPHWHK